MNAPETAQTPETAQIIDWSKETDFKKINFAEELQAAAAGCQLSIFPDLLENFADAEAEDKRKGLVFIKAGLKDCKDAQERKAKRALIAEFVARQAEQEANQSAAPAAPANDQPATAVSSAEAKNLLNALASSSENLARVIGKVGGEVEKLKLSKEEDREAVQELAATVEKLAATVQRDHDRLEGFAGIFTALADRVTELEEAAVQQAAADKKKLATAVRDFSLK